MAHIKPTPETGNRITIVKKGGVKVTDVDSPFPPNPARNDFNERKNMKRVRCANCGFVTLMSNEDFAKRMEACTHCKSFAFDEIGAAETNEGKNSKWFNKPQEVKK